LKDAPLAPTGLRQRRDFDPVEVNQSAPVESWLLHFQTAAAVSAGYRARCSRSPTTRQQYDNLRVFDSCQITFAGRPGPGSQANDHVGNLPAPARVRSYQLKGLTMRLILIIILIVILLGALPTWPYSSGWGYYPSGGLGAIIVILLILWLVGVI
jgi:hypothetical protein